MYSVCVSSQTLLAVDSSVAHVPLCWYYWLRNEFIICSFMLRKNNKYIS